MEAKKSFGDAIVSQELNKEAWKKLSREFKWNEELLRKYRSEIDWEELSENIVKILSDDDIRGAMVKEGLLHAGKFSDASIAQNLFRTYKKIL